MRWRVLAAVTVNLVLAFSCSAVPGVDAGFDDGGSVNGARPDVMILLDKSGSMAAPINSSDPNCPAASCPGAGCPANCPTRISEVRNALNTFLTTWGTVARLGLTAYPTDPTCGAPNAVRVDLSQSKDIDSELKAKASEINAQVQGIAFNGSPGSPNAVGGGTPIGPALNFLGTYAPLQDTRRADFVLLLTDGLPNCNPQNSNTCLNAAACRCTTTSCGTDMSAPFCTLGCLDQDGAVLAVNSLRQRAIRTIVIGFGAEAGTGDGPVVLNAMAEAGGFARSCPTGTNAECGSNNTCDQATGLCNSRFYQATNAAELSAALADIARILSARP